jgi:hypothetical protein
LHYLVTLGKVHVVLALWSLGFEEPGRFWSGIEAGRKELRGRCWHSWDTSIHQ